MLIVPSGHIPEPVFGFIQRFLRFLFGSKQKITILVPGDTVDEIAICESKEGGSVHESC